MYKMIIADDEKIIQEGLAELIDWNEMGFEIAETFSDGAEVIEYLDTMPVDVVLTDIRMKHVGGIDVARYVQEAKIPCKVVFISGHKEFELAVQAIKYGVKDYILKPSDEEDVKAVFEKIKTELDRNVEDKAYRARVEEHWTQIHPVLEEKFLNGLILGVVENNSKIAQRMQFLYPEIDAERCPCMLMDLKIQDYNAFIGTKWNYSSDQFQDAIYHFTEIFEGAGLFRIIYKYKDKIRLFAIMSEYCESEEENRRLCDSQMKQFVRQFGEIFGTELTVEAGSIFRNIYQVKEWHEDYIRKDERQQEIGELWQEQKKVVMTNILLGNVNTVMQDMESIIKGLDGVDIRYCRNIVVDIFSCISEVLRQNNQNLYFYLKPFIDYHSIMEMSSITEIEVYCKRFFNKMMMCENSKDPFNKSGMINRVKEYVQEHIYEDILLEDVANEVYISVSHFGRVFKKQTGETFLQYVTRMKMEKAAELLKDSKYKVYQVGEMLGYKTHAYFSKVFYNVIGCYPGEYRKKQLHTREVADE